MTQSRSNPFGRPDSDLTPPSRRSMGDIALIFAGGILVSSVAALVMVLLFAPKAPQRSLGDYESPQLVRPCDPRVGDGTGLICVREAPSGPDGLKRFERGDVVGIDGKRCVNSKEPITILTYRTFTRIVAEGEKPAAASASTRVSEQRRAPGGACDHVLTMVAMPAAVTPGIWRIDGFDLSSKDGEVRVWNTEDFRVEGPP